MRSIARFACIAVLTIAPGLQAQSGVAHGTWRIEDAPPELRPAISHGDLIVVSLQDTLLRELTKELAKGDPASALSACHVDVMGVLQRIGRTEAIAAGRTSHRLRNAANAPKPWAAALVEANAGRKVTDVDGYVVDLGHSIGLLRPIAHRPLCAVCHGRSDEITPGVQRALGERYPADRAVGFAEGDIRGWFWVEVPKTRK